MSAAADPVHNESFLRWSKTASTILSDQSQFYFNGKRSTGQFSDFSGSYPTPASLAAAAASPNSSPARLAPMYTVGKNVARLASPPPPPHMGRSYSQPESVIQAAQVTARPDTKRRESANSDGTFGSNQRRWSTIHTATAAASSPLSENGERLPPTLATNLEAMGPPNHLEFGSIKRNRGELTSCQDDDEDNLKGPTSSRPKARRPVSMSSASDSTFSGAGQRLAGLGISTPRERIRVGRSNISGANFPSPTLRRRTHKSPESEAEITAHLMKASGKDDSRIVPRLGEAFQPTILHKSKPPSPTKFAPSVGTPLVGKVREEGSVFGDSSDEGARTRVTGARTSKLDQILGEGAEKARLVMELEKRAIEDAVDMPAG